MEIEKSTAAGGACTTKVAVAVWVSEPLVPVTVKMYEPAGVVELVVTIRAEDVLAGLGLKLALAPAGRPLADSDTNPLKPPEGETLTV